MLCYLAHIEKLRREDEGKNAKLDWIATKLVKEQVMVHYEKGHVITLHENNIIQKILALHQEYANLRKLNPDRRANKVKQFQQKLQTTMPFWPRNAEKRMEDSKKGKNDAEKRVTEEDIVFLNSMMTDRAASNCSQDKVTSKIEEKGSYVPNKQK